MTENILPISGMLREDIALQLQTGFHLLFRIWPYLEKQMYMNLEKVSQHALSLLLTTIIYTGAWMKTGKFRTYNQILKCLEKEIKTRQIICYKL